MELAYQLWRAEQNETAKIMFLHGMGGTGSLWRPVAAALEEHYTILAPDQRGHGGSIVPASSSASRTAPSYAPLDYGKDLVELLQALQFHPTWVVGHSMGVRSACALAYLRKDWVFGLVLVDLGFSGVAGGGLGEDLAQFLKKLPDSFPSRALARAFMQAESPEPSIGQYLMAVSVQKADGSIHFPLDRAALIETIHAARDSSVRTWVTSLAEQGMPILVLRGSMSRVWNAGEFEREKAALAAYPNVAFETVEGATHGLPFEKRVEFVTRIERFIAENSKSSQPPA